MEKISAWLLLVLGILLVLNLLGIDQLGTPVDGIMGWAIAVIVVVFSVHKIMEAHK